MALNDEGPNVSFRMLTCDFDKIVRGDDICLEYSNKNNSLLFIKDVIWKDNVGKRFRGRSSRWITRFELAVLEGACSGG